MSEMPAPVDSGTRAAAIDPAFRNGSMTAISVMLGFSLTFLNRWAALSGDWHKSDLAAVTAIVLGIALQVTGLARLLWPSSLELVHYHRAVTLFLVGLGLVLVGIVVAIAADLLGAGQNVLGG